MDSNLSNIVITMVSPVIFLPIYTYLQIRRDKRYKKLHTLALIVHFTGFWFIAKAFTEDTLFYDLYKYTSFYWSVIFLETTMRLLLELINDNKELNKKQKKKAKKKK